MIKAGEKYGMLTAIERKRRDKNRCWFWLCQCDCGNIKEIRDVQLRSAARGGYGSSRGCGCLRAAQLRKLASALPQDTKDPLYSVWNSMKKRCRPSSKSKVIEHYGKRGITVCDRWANSFSNFKLDMGSRPEGYSIERINNDGNYEPGNCRWATQTEQVSNRRTNKFVVFNGVRRTIGEWARIFGLTWSAINHRVRQGWAPEKIFLTPTAKGVYPHI